MKFVQLIEYIRREIFFVKNYAENEAERLLVLDLFLFSKKSLYEVKATGL